MGARRMLHSIPLLSSRPVLNFSNAISRSVSAVSRPFSKTSESSPPRKFPSTGFELIDPSEKVEEERLPFYKRDEYYPMKIGHVVYGHYQIVAKLGYGATSTVWLSRDLRNQKYWVLKVHINSLKYNHELAVYRHLAHHTEDHPGRNHVREFHDSFTLKGPNGNHEVFVMEPLGMSLRSLQGIQRDGAFPEQLVIGALAQVFLALDFLHEADVIHTDVHSDNLLIGIVNKSIFSTVEENEIHKPSPRKVVGDTVTQVSQYMLGGKGPLILCDLGQARIGREHHGNAMPVPYRAPEVILNMPWGNSVDAWSAGLLAWDLLRGESLFNVYDHESRELNDAHHLAAITALIGPPPPELLQSSEDSRKYWHENGSLVPGEWKGPVPLPPKKDFESLISDFIGVDKENFVSFMECFIAWLPNDRLTCLQGHFHPWLKTEKNPAAT
ncbi:serine/threonine protein kinase domain protein [Metarhizium robertsii]|uniref:non-specific serine/threonine protein kinase n=1 Tax=Metarhizium robertsii TaxID=568076 RepID=A0A014P4S1_9HYPO|nr:serine/threonine protein kinase domain protein [Metarhizium robertsii]